MKTITILKGLPASGKSTWAKNKIDKNPGMYKRINKDDIRAMLDNSKWSKDNEKFILKVRNELIVMSLNEGKHVIVDDTNGHPKHIENIKKLVKGMCVEVKVKEFNVSVDTCVKRDLDRPNSVGERVIRDMYNSFFKPEDQIYVRDRSKPASVIFDIDGTLALMDGNRSPYDWDKVDTDLVNGPVRDVLELYHKEGYTIILLSGRDGSSRNKTVKWLNTHQIPYSHLFMRVAGDNRKDSIVKRELFDNYVRDKYNVELVYDDRNQVVELWREMGLTCFQVAEGNF